MIVFSSVFLRELLFVLIIIIITTSSISSSNIITNLLGRHSAALCLSMHFRLFFGPRCLKENR